MPSDFDEMAGYHNRLAAHFQALAQEARERGSRNEAEFLTAQAMRYAAAAESGRHAFPGRFARHSPFRFPAQGSLQRGVASLSADLFRVATTGETEPSVSVSMKAYHACRVLTAA